jgi:hypothetical protein
MIKKQKYVMDFVTGICVPEIEMNLTSVNVVGGMRPLNITWTPELAQDLTAYHGIDAEAELTTLLSEEIAREIDRDIINTLIGIEPIETPEPENGFDRLTFPIARREHPQLLANDIVPVQPLGLPNGIPYYMDVNNEYNIMNKVTWRTSDTWEYNGLFGSLIGVTMEIKKHEFIPKKKRSFLDRITLPRVNRRFS